MGRRIVGGTLLALLALTSPAAAATDRYAEPLGNGPEPCASSDPCSATDAVGGLGAAAGDTVHLAGGDYLTRVDVNKANMTVVGPSTGPRAHIHATGDLAVGIFQPGVTLRDLDLTATNATASGRVLALTPTATSFTGERLRVTAAGDTGTGVAYHDGTLLRDSFVSVAAPSGVALAGLRAGTISVVNVTARAAGNGGRALMATSDSMSAASTQEVTVVNSILQGGADPGGRDIDLEGSVDKTVRVLIDHSHFQTREATATWSQLVEGAGNQTAEPQFELDGISQAAGSPTINAGRTLAQLGTKDLFGGARPSGSAPDIGAHELQETAPATGGGAGGDDDDVTPPAVTGSTPPAVTGSTPPTQAARDTSVPALTALRMSRRRFRASRGTTFGWTLSEPATVVIALERRLPGLRVRRQGRVQCLLATAKLKRHLRGKRQRRCTIFRLAGTLRRTAPAGASALRFRGRVGSRTFPAGTYRATVTATDAAANRSPARRLSFTIVRR